MSGATGGHISASGYLPHEWVLPDEEEVLQYGEEVGFTACIGQRAVE